MWAEHCWWWWCSPGSSLPIGTPMCPHYCCKGPCTCWLIYLLLSHISSSIPMPLSTPFSVFFLNSNISYSASSRVTPNSSLTELFRVTREDARTQWQNVQLSLPQLHAEDNPSLHQQNLASISPLEYFATFEQDDWSKTIAVYLLIPHAHLILIQWQVVLPWSR